MSDLASLDRSVERLVKKQRIPGLSMTLMRDDGPVVSKGYGFRDLASRRPATPETVFGLGSITKSFTALALLRLQEHGALKLTDLVTDHLPSFRTPQRRWARRTQLLHLLTHSSGLPPLPTICYTCARSLRRDPTYDSRADRRKGVDTNHPPIDTYDQLLEYLATGPYRLLGPPGKYFSYSNEGFGLLGAVIERASGHAYEQFVEEEILRPAEMRRTTFDPGVLSRFPEVTTLYSRRPRSKRRVWVASDDWWEDGCVRAAGGLRASLADLGQYLELYVRHGRVGRERIVSRASIEAMLRPRMAIWPGLYYGYGIAIRPEYHGTLLAYHEGSLPGVSAAFGVMPKKKLAGAVLANAAGVGADRLLSFGLNLLLGVPLHRSLSEIPPIRGRTDGLNGHTGAFASGEGDWFRTRSTGRRLRLQFIGGDAPNGPMRLAPNGPDEFILGPHGRDGYLRFERDAEGRIWAAFRWWRVVRRRRESDLKKARTGAMIW